MLLGHDTANDPGNTNEDLDAQVVNSIPNLVEEINDSDISAPCSHHSDPYLHQTQQKFFNVSNDQRQLPSESCIAFYPLQEALTLQPLP